MKDLASIIRADLEKQSKVIFLHSNADLDSVGSAIALKLFFDNARLCAPAGISHLGKKLLGDMNIEASDDFDLQQDEKAIVVDAHGDSSLGYGGIDWPNAIVIDHHGLTGELIASASYIDETATSTCELVWDIIGKSKELNEKIAMALMAGILADTGHLKRGSHRTLAAASEILLASGLCMDDLVSVFNSSDDQDMSRRISRLKGAQRLKHHRIGQWLIAVSEVGAFESAVCHALLNIGADVAIVGSQKDDDFRITGRATKPAVKAGIHLGNMMNLISQECGGEGGGHDGAAGFSGTGDVEAMLNICVDNSMATLKGKERD